MSLTNEKLNEFINNNPYKINDLSKGIKYYNADLLEDYNEKTDIPFNFTYNYKNKEKYQFDAYFRITDDETLKFVYNTKIDDIYHCREFEDLESLKDLKNIFKNQIYELIAVNSGDEDEEEEDEEDEDDDE